MATTTATTSTVQERSWSNPARSPAESVSLARLACDVDGDDPARPLLDGILQILARASELAVEEDGKVRFPPSATLLVAALSIARTPAAPLPA